MKRILVFTVTLLLTVLFSACSEQPTQFSVTMGEQYAQHEPITLTVTLPTNAKEHEITFTIDGKVVTPQYNEKGWYIETEGIAAKHLEEMHTFCVGGLTVKYGPMSYVLSKLSSTKAEDVNLAKAVYGYWQAAEALLG